MQKIKIETGYLAYKVKRSELTKIGGLGICDDCNITHELGYLVPVLNRWLCPDCFGEWSRSCVYYPEDIPIEARNCKYYENMMVIET